MRVSTIAPLSHITNAQTGRQYGHHTLQCWLYMRIIFVEEWAPGEFLFYFIFLAIGGAGKW
jgi:hypothetical protein